MFVTLYLTLYEGSVIKYLCIPLFYFQLGSAEIALDYYKYITGGMMKE